VSAADALCVLFILLACAIAAFGGHRVRLDAVSISVRSWERPLAAALVIGLVRHLAEKQMPLHVRIGALARALIDNAALRAAVGPFVATRASVLLAGYLAVVTIGFAGQALPFRISFNEFVNLPARWDVQWYLQIANDGYSWNGNPEQMQSVVFYPALPVFMHVGALFTGSLVYGGLLASLAAFLLALTYLYRLAEPLVGPARASAALWLLAAYPFSVYYSAPYTEALYLLACTGAFAHLSRGEPGAAAGWGILTGFSRPNGFLLVAPLLLMVLIDGWRHRTVPVRRCAATLTPLVGPIAFSLFLYWQFGDATAWLKGQVAWGRAYGGLFSSLWDVVLNRYNLVSHVGLYRYTLGQPFDFLHTVTGALTVAALWPVWKFMGAPYALFVAINVLPPLMTGSTMSLGRMTSVLFPTFVGVAAAVPRRYHTPIIAALCVLQGVIAAAFFTWRDAY
jgi:hypothetical protein